MKKMDAKTTISEREKRLALAVFKEQTDVVLKQLEQYHHSTLIQIDNVFNKLFTNVPQEIIDTPVSVCQQSYLKLLGHNPVIKNVSQAAAAATTSTADKQEDMNISYKIPRERVDDSTKTKESESHEQNETNLMDFETHLSNKDLTSTVKKLVTTKAVFGKNANTAAAATATADNKNTIQCIDDSIINEENTIENISSSMVEPTREMILNNLSITISYKLKNGNMVTKKLGELCNTDFRDVNEAEVEYLRKICNILN